MNLKAVSLWLKLSYLRRGLLQHAQVALADDLPARVGAAPAQLLQDLARAAVFAVDAVALAEAHDGGAAVGAHPYLGRRGLDVDGRGAREQARLLRAHGL